ncbi:fibronectin type III domain protein [Ruminiclostridium hungatei]|uniref:Fibronectin type III domain protein n=1 Tax=Ruminiclostridium hungatei TaxID=48256 RepID=A0A1V4SM69_RUMHU|nr:fibronectin type III domain-containing protein [Ruminiclostridium hungatei]OPX44321.1 fibronectin type III domain protein [Ruminiclostridium hungatei]
MSKSLAKKVFIFILLFAINIMGFGIVIDSGNLKFSFGEAAYCRTNYYDISKVRAGYLWNASFYENQSYANVSLTADSILLNVPITGAISSAASDYIPVTVGKEYTMNFSQQGETNVGTRSIYIFYNSNKERISGETSVFTTTTIIKPPAGAAYIRWFFAPTAGDKTCQVRYSNIEFYENLMSFKLDPSMDNLTCQMSLPVKGIVENSSSGDILDIVYSMDDDSEQVLYPGLESKGTAQPVDAKIDIRALSEGVHNLSIWIRDSKGRVSEPVRLSFNKIRKISMSVSDVTKNSAGININDENAESKLYRVKINNKYLSEAGEISVSPDWIRKSTTNTAINIGKLSPGVKYTLSVTAYDINSLELDESKSVQFTTPVENLSAPVISKTDSSAESITIAWNPIKGAEKYEIEADGITTSSSALSFTHSKLQQNTRHTYRVRSRDGENISEWSLPIKVSTKKALPEIPGNITAAAIGTSIAVSWGKVANALNYEIEADGSIKTVSGTAYTMQGLKPDTLHTFRIRAVGFSGTSNWSPIERIFTTDGLITDMPQNITAVASNTTIALSWDAVDDAEDYDILPVLENGTMGTAVDNGSLTTCEFRGLRPNTAYRYVVRARNSAGEGPYSREIQVMTYLLDTPGNVKIEKNDTYIKFSWDKVESADSYQLIYAGVTGGEAAGAGAVVELESSGTRIDVLTGTSVTITGLTPCTEYKYSIRAKSSNGYSSWREVKSCFTLPHRPEIPDNVSASVSDTKIIISWTGMDDPAVTGYDIELDGIVLENDTETGYIHEGLTPYSLHTYRVRARNDLVEGEWSPENTIRTLPSEPQSPKNIVVKSTQTGATLTWKEEQGAAGYDIYVFRLDESNNEVKVEEINNIEDCTYTHRRQVKGEEYRYRLRTRNIRGISAWSGDVINNAIKAECKKGSTLDLGLTATDVVDFGSYEMVVTYNPGVVQVADLSTLTGAAELTTGKIEGTGITIKEFSQGRIVFVVDRAVTPGEAWTGVINGIKFKARETGGTTITYTVFTRQE